MHRVPVPEERAGHLVEGLHLADRARVVNGAVRKAGIDAAIVDHGRAEAGVLRGSEGRPHRHTVDEVVLDEVAGGVLVVDEVALHRRGGIGTRSVGVAAQGELVEDRAGVIVQHPEGAAAVPDEDAAAGDGRRLVDRAVRRELPEQIQVLDGPLGEGFFLVVEGGVAEVEVELVPVDRGRRLRLERGRRRGGDEDECGGGGDARDESLAR